MSGITAEIRLEAKTNEIYPIVVPSYQNLDSNYSGLNLTIKIST